MGRKLGVCPFLEGRTGSPSNTVAWAETYLHTKWHLDGSSCLATRHGPKIGGYAPFLGPGRHLYNVARAEAYLHAKFHLD